MSPWNGDSTKAGEQHPLDDETVEELVSGRYSGNAADLVALAQALDGMHAYADQAPPRPSPALERLLNGSATAGREPAADPWRVPATQPPSSVADRRPTDRARPKRRRAFRWVPAALVAVGASAVALTTAASAGVLPDPAQRVMASVVRAVTPFEVPEPTSAAVLRRRETPTTTTPAGTAGPGGPTGSAIAGSAPGATAPPPVTAAPHTPAGGPSVAPSGGSGAPEATPGATAPGVPAVPTGPSAAPGQVKPDLTATLTGSAVVPKAGDPDGSGTAAVTLDVGRSQLCLQLSLSEVGAASAVHVHAGAKGNVGPVVATFVPPLEATGSSCVAVPRDALAQMRAHPSDFYVDVHTAEFPDGAVRGQLDRP